MKKKAKRKWQWADGEKDSKVWVGPIRMDVWFVSEADGEGWFSVFDVVNGREYAGQQGGKMFRTMAEAKKFAETAANRWLRQLEKALERTK